jgi:hypothetical protein
VAVATTSDFSVRAAKGNESTKSETVKAMALAGLSERLDEVQT